MSRYQVIPKSQSCHCCFEATVVDTVAPPVWPPRFNTVCECFELKEAEMIAASLNKTQWDEQQACLHHPPALY